MISRILSDRSRAIQIAVAIVIFRLGELVVPDATGIAEFISELILGLASATAVLVVTDLLSGRPRFDFLWALERDGGQISLKGEQALVPVPRGDVVTMRVTISHTCAGFVALRLAKRFNDRNTCFFDIALSSNAVCESHDIGRGWAVSEDTADPLRYYPGKLPIQPAEEVGVIRMALTLDMRHGDLPVAVVCRFLDRVGEVSPTKPRWLKVCSSVDSLRFVRTP